MSILKVEIDGAIVDSDDVSWYYYAPCGCCAGVTMLTRANGFLASEEDVWREWEPNPTTRKRDRAAGFNFQLGLRAKVRELLTPECPHEPKWGVTETVVPDAHRWAASEQRPTMRDRKHIVLTEHTVDTPRKGEPFPEWTGIKHESLCGRNEMRWWGDQFSVSDLPECSRCIAKAKKLVSNRERA